MTIDRNLIGVLCPIDLGELINEFVTKIRMGWVIGYARRIRRIASEIPSPFVSFYLPRKRLQIAGSNHVPVCRFPQSFSEIRVVT